MLIGVHHHTLDAKSRMVLPSKFRKDMGESYVVTCGLDKCLYAYSLSEWEKLSAKLNELSMLDAEVRGFVRFFVGNAEECNPDGNGRTLLQNHLKERVGITKEIVFVGVSTKVEIWSKDEWDNASPKNYELPDSIKEILAGFGI
jgi:MraZ protein